MMPSPKTLHPQHADFLLKSFRDNQLRKAAEVRIHNVDRHLNGVEMEAVLFGHFEHIKMNARILVASKSDEAHFSLFLSLEHRFHRSTLAKDPVGVIEANYFVVLQQIDMICLQR